MTSLPNIIITEPDHGRLSRFVGRPGSAFFSVADFLEGELQRAEVIHPDEVPADVVTMDSKVRFRKRTFESWSQHPPALRRVNDFRSLQLAF